MSPAFPICVPSGTSTCLLTLVLVRLVTSPLRRLVQDMWLLSRMYVTQPMTFPRSCLSEVNALVRSFDLLRRSLREYRKFMPETLWVGRDEALRLAADKDCPEPPAFSKTTHSGHPTEDHTHPGVSSGMPQSSGFDLEHLEQHPVFPEWGLQCPLCPAPAGVVPTCAVACFDITGFEEPFTDPRQVGDACGVGSG